MKHLLRLDRVQTCIVTIIAALAGFGAARIQAADKTWDGGGADGNWQTGANWNADTAPAGGDTLIFGGTTRLNNTNNFATGTLFNGITINSPAGAFTLRGSPITLGGDIVNNQTLVPEVIGLSLSLGATRSVNVVTDGLLTLGGAISGSGAGLTKTGGGLLTLTASNTFNGLVTVNAGTLSVASDTNLGAAPSAPEAGRIVLNGGALRTTSSFSLNANRGVALGPSTGSGAGTINVNSDTTLSYGGIIANNGAGTGGLTKIRFGGLTLSRANTYTGPTAIRNGTLTLDFTQTASPLSNVISSSSPLVLGGENAGLGTLSYAAVIANGKASTTNSQTFNGTTVDIGPAIIRANGGASGTANLILGTLTHNPGGTAVFVPPSATGGAGNITTPTANVNGILGSWALFSDGAAPVGNVTSGTTWASVNANGEVVPYSGYTDYTSGNLAGAVTAGTNLRVTTASHPGGTAAAEVRVAAEGAGTVTDINTISIQNAVNSDTLVVGAGNTLRLGKFGGIFRQDITTAGVVLYFGGTGGTQTGNGAAGSQGVGTITAGGADNTPGEIVFTVNAPSQTAGSFIVEPTITDNGTGKVTVIKNGPGSMKIDGHNTYSGGLYVLQGRVQFAGSELGGATFANPDGGGTGPIYVMPGGQLFPSGGNGIITNDLFLAGLGGGAFSSGALRMSGGSQNLAGQITLLGDVFICGGGNNNTNGQITGKITGPFSFGVGMSGGGENITTYYRIFNQNNDYSGDTVISVRDGGAPLTTLLLGDSNVIPDGVGKGNLVLRPGTTTAATLDMFGSNETINGLSVATATTANAIVQNSAAGTTSTLTVGNYDASSTFAGLIKDNGGVIALRKIGGGVLALTGANAYTGETRVESGTLALSGAGSIATSTAILVNGATLDVSGVTGGFASTSPVGVNNGTLVVSTTTDPGIGNLSLTNSTLQLAISPTATNVRATTLTTAGASNVVNISSLLGVASYPIQFTLVKYTGSISGAGYNFTLGTLPGVNTKGFLSNNVANSSVDLVLTDGPKALNWTGATSGDWNIAAAANWQSGTTASVYQDYDFVTFDDAANGTTSVNLTTTLGPSSITVNSSTKTYTLTGPGKLSGGAALVKNGSGTLILANTGANDFSGGVTINAGTLQVGNGGAGGNLPAGDVVNNGALVFNSSDDLTIASVISGNGPLTKNGAGALTLSGANTYSGATTISQGTLKVGNNTALGDNTGATTVSSGATLDVNGRSLTDETMTVSGAGVGGLGAIVNTGADNNNALGAVTLAGDTTFGGTGRWDIRGGAAALNTGGSAFKLTKVGPGQVSLAGANVDPALGDIDVQRGIFSVEGATTSLGNPASRLTVAAGATLQFLNTTTPWEKVFVLNGDGSAVTVNNAAGANVVNSAITVNGSCIVSASGGSLTFSGALGGSGSLTKIGAAVVVIGGSANYTGTTTVSGGTLSIDGAKTGAGAIAVNAGGTLGGIGQIGSPVTVAANGTVSPGNTDNPTSALTINNTLGLAGTCSMNVSKSGGAFVNDTITGVTTLTLGGTLRLNIDSASEPLTAGDSIKLFTAANSSGAFSTIVPATPGDGLSWDVSSLVSTGTLRVAVGAPPQPDLETVVLSGSNLIVSGTGGTPNGIYSVLSSTNVALPLINWTRLSTNNIFTSSGGFAFTNAVNPSTPQQFFLIQVP